MHETCCGCPNHTPNGECYIGTIENCVLDKKEKIEQMHYDAKIECENMIDTLLFYMNEYNIYLSYEEIAKIFTEEFNKFANKIARELTEREEEEENY